MKKTYYLDYNKSSKAKKLVNYYFANYSPLDTIDNINLFHGHKCIPAKTRKELRKIYKYNFERSIYILLLVSDNYLLCYFDYYTEGMIYHFITKEKEIVVKYNFD